MMFEKCISVQTFNSRVWRALQAWILSLESGNFGGAGGYCNLSQCNSKPVVNVGSSESGSKTSEEIGTDLHVERERHCLHQKQSFTLNPFTVFA